MKERKIIYSALQTPDGTIIQSTHRHDYKTHVDKNGKEYMIDGGHSYIRRSDNGDEKLITVYADEPHKRVRQYYSRSGYGKRGDRDYGIYRTTLLKDMSDSYLDQAIEYVKEQIRNVPEIILIDLEDDEHPIHYQILLNEKEYRRQNKIKVNGK